jgi:DNA-binding PadR family transcriptional regulator
MLPADEPVLSLCEWIVLVLVAERPAHGHPLVVLLGRDGDLGQIWHVHRALVYRSLDRLAKAGLIRPAGEQASDHGPARSLFEVTEAGRAAGGDWLHRPARHNRDIRSELLVKLALLNRRGADPQHLVGAQHDQLVPIADALRERIGAASGFDRTLLLWRYEAASASLRFLEGLMPVSP